MKLISVQSGELVQSEHHQTYKGTQCVGTQLCWDHVVEYCSCSWGQRELEIETVCPHEELITYVLEINSYSIYVKCYNLKYRIL